MMQEVGDVILLTGDSLELLREFPENSVHACVTDPPYGIGFMGKKWDTFSVSAAESRAVNSQVKESNNPNLKGRVRSPASSPSAIDYDRSLAGQRGFQAWTEQWAREVFRVLRPGAHLLVCGAPRSYHRMAVGVEDAGFEIRDCLAWMFAQGFPKSHNLHGEWEGWGTALKPSYEPILLARKPLEGTVAQNVAKWGCGALNIDGCRIKTAGVNPSIARRKGTINHLSDRPAAETEAEGKMVSRQSPEAYRAERPGELLGRWPANLLHDGSDEVLECFPDAAGQLADAKTSNVYGAMARTNEPSQDDLNEGEVGFKMKPGARRLDSGSAARFFYSPKASKKDRNEGLDSMCTVKYDALEGNTPCDVSNAVILLQKVTQDIQAVNWRIGASGVSITGQCPSAFLSTTLTEIRKIMPFQTLNSSPRSFTNESILGANSEGASGGNLARGAINSNPLSAPTGTFQKKDGLCMGGANLVILRLLSWVSDGANWKPATNFHCTVKPTALMRYLIKLVTPPGGTVLDPFFGSGSTGKACILEGFACIGIERDASYMAIARARCEHAMSGAK
ncbi:MAG: Modification methylase HindIII [Firmicutes bacterium]|nr:Modification methylase HindIII [Bacillota bacterium]